MATVNITADMNADEVVTIADATAEAGIHLFQFFTDGKNMFNIASQSISGAAADEVTVTPDTEYEFTIPAEQAQLLDGAASTYQHYLLDGDGGKTLKNEGSVTVTPLSGTSLPVIQGFLNGDRITSTGAAVSAYAADEADDTIYCSPGNLVETVITLPEANKMLGKKYEIKLMSITGGTVRVNTPDASELITLATGGDNCIIRARGGDADDWQVFSQYIQP